ncbi:glycerate kinase [Pseudactinotalea sp. Z1739]|uniref:glycerate kinase n=1 Tax=Pseudactinotalea sp. Z1739 TaxID=3413028 RepID=UPI003C7A72C2
MTHLDLTTADSARPGGTPTPDSPDRRAGVIELPIGPDHPAGPLVVVAPDTFKGSLNAKYVAQHIALGLHRALEDVEVQMVPMADGGEGTLSAVLVANLQPVRVRVSGPFGEPVKAMYATDGRRAVIELAQAAGLHLSPADADAAQQGSTIGVGELIAHALDSGVQELVLAVGGSATTDGGAGMLQALGARLHGVTGPGGAALRDLRRVDLSGLHPRLAEVGITLAADVDNPLLGPNGAAAVYAPQKGAGPDQVAALQAGLTRWVQALEEAGMDARATAQAAGAGAAGGTGFAALVLGARRRPGVEVVLELVEFERKVRGADLVVTGEGKLDSQSLAGKAPVGVAAAATDAAVVSVAVAGVNELTEEEVEQAGFSGVYALSDLEPDLERSKARAGELLERVAARIAARHLWTDLDQ